MSDYIEYTSRMDKTLASLEKQYATVRAGRANAAVLDQIRVEYYGTPINIFQASTCRAKSRGPSAAAACALEDISSSASCWMTMVFP